MTVAGTSSTAALGDAAPQQRASWWRGPRFVVEVFDGADEALAALEAVQGGLVSTGFQSLNWLTFIYEELASAQRALPRLVVVTERNSGGIAMILPLVIKKKRTLRVARFADFGVSGYGAPILGPAVLKKPRSMRRIWRAVRHALRDVDLIRLERMPAEIGGRPNPLLAVRGVAPSRRGGNSIVITGTVDDFVASLVDTTLPDADRRTRRWQQAAAPQFVRAETATQVARAYAALEEQQEAAAMPPDAWNLIDDPAYRQFYERLVMDGSEIELGYMFTLEAGGEAAFG